MALNDTVIMDALKWHTICYELGFDDRKAEFEEYFNCTTTWRSRLDQWSGEDVSERPNPVMILQFLNSSDASLFVLRWL